MSDTVEFENRTPENLKIAPLSDRAFRLWFNAACYCHRNSTDGKVPAVLILSLSRTASKRVVDELLQARLLEPLADRSYYVHDYLEHNPSRADIEAARSRSRDRTARWRESARDAVSDASRDEGVTGHRSVSRAGAAPAAPEEKRSTPEMNKATEKTLLVCDRLAEQIRNCDPGANLDPRSERWLREARLLLAARSFEQVIAVLDWLATDNFWPTVILSMAKFREKFSQLVIKMNAAASGTAPNGKPSPSELIRKLEAAEAAR